MPYIQFDGTKPDPTVDNGTTACSNIRLNEAAIRDAAMMGSMPGWQFNQAGPTDEPTVLSFTKGTESLYQNVTWSGGNITQIVTSYQPNTATALAAVATAVMTYTSGELTLVTGAAGLLYKTFALFGKVKAVVANLAAHIANTGTAVHGLSSMATQASGGVAITGGTIASTPISGAAGTFTIERETMLAPTFTIGANTLTASACGWIECTLPTSGTVTISAIVGVAPAGLSGGVVVDFVIPGPVPTIVWGANIRWPGGVAPTFAAGSYNLCTFQVRNNVDFWFGNYSGSYA